jgi:hypothetical protein
MGINIRFTVGVIVIIVVGFSASAYFFSMNPLGEFTDSISIVTVNSPNGFILKKYADAENPTTIITITPTVNLMFIPIRLSLSIL